MEKKVLFILSGNLSTTPRAFKNILSLGSDKCEVISVSRSEKWHQLDVELALKHSISIHHTYLFRKVFLKWLFTALLYKILRLVYPVFRKNVFINSFSSEKASLILWVYLRRFRSDNYSTIFAQGYGAIFPAFHFSRNSNAKCFVDIEDYHPGESICNFQAYEKERREYILKSILPKVSHSIFSSPLIARQSIDLISTSFQHNVILNSFPEGEFIEPKPIEGALKMVWFSQKISSGRGLELLFEALNDLTEKPWELSLIGDLDERFKKNIPETIIRRIQFFPAMSQVELHSTLSDYDIGLSLESSNIDLNRDLCLTNKFFAYIQAGLFLLATDTSAQKEFLREESEFGVLCEQNASSILESLLYLMDKLPYIRENRRKRFSIAKQFSWEKQQTKILKLL